MSFKSIRDRIRNKSRETGIKADVLYRRYLLERFIARIADSEHRESMIIKGGMLISANTLKWRDMSGLLPKAPTILAETLNHPDVQLQWSKYRRQHSYAEDIEWGQVAEAVTQAFVWAGVT